jgi:MFS family permease
MPDILLRFDLEPAYLSYLSSAVQAGFISGTLMFAVFGVSDRYSPSKVFFVSALVAAVINLAVLINTIDSNMLMLIRFLTGFFLAGIYPVGMKIAADHYEKGLGRSLGFLVGALVLGTAIPHLLKSIAAALPWKFVIYTTSTLAAMGGLSMYLMVPDGPYRKASQKFDPTAFLKGFRSRQFRAAALGYFGHMWELYAFWVFVPVILATYLRHHPNAVLNTSLLSFLIIAAGSLACVVSGLVSQSWGTKRTATAALLLSCVCCLVSPLFLLHNSPTLVIIFLFIWSIVVIADSPLFSTLVAQNAPAESKGTSLTIVNCIGFSITIVSIQLLNALLNDSNARYIYVVLAAGPALGLLALIRRT